MIFSYLNVDAVAKLMQVNKKINKLCNNWAIWKDLLLHSYYNIKDKSNSYSFDFKSNWFTNKLVQNKGNASNMTFFEK